MATWVVILGTMATFVFSSIGYVMLEFRKIVASTIIMIIIVLIIIATIIAI